MSLIVSLGEEVILGYIKTGANANWSAQLYTSNTTPSASDVKSTYTLPTFTGSAAVALSSWGSVSLSSGEAQMVHPTVTWTLSSGSGQTCFGYIIFDGSGNLIAATRFGATQTVTNPGDNISVNITMDFFDVSLCS